ncbi:MAG: hypothetical protein E7231_00110 [Cellulosilyticum sp.]|nr:hypothetical protein [Cellulosilyticum sp.]
MEKVLLVGSCIGALAMIAYSIHAIGSVEDKVFQIIGGILLSFTSLRYITLLIYAYSTNLRWIVSMRYFYYASSIGITMLTALAVWYVMPFLKKGIKLVYYLLCFLPWNLFYLYIIVKQPTCLVENSAYGYELLLVSPFERYLSIAQGSFIGVMTILCVIGIFKYKHPQIRTQLLMILLAQGLLVIDGIASGDERILLFKLFTVTEAFALAVTGHIVGNGLKQIHAIKNQ